MTFRCFYCGFFFGTADNYKVHLIAAHPDTPLAKRSAKERKLSEKKMNAGIKKPIAAKTATP